MCIIDGNVDCIVNPISNAINQIIAPFSNWVLGILEGIWDFITGITVLFQTIYDLIYGLLYSIFSTNSYAAITFSVILMGISLIIFIRIYNIIAGITIFGFKLPRL